MQQKQTPPNAADVEVGMNEKPDSKVSRTAGGPRRRGGKQQQRDSGKDAIAHRLMRRRSLVPATEPLDRSPLVCAVCSNVPLCL